MMHIDVNSVLRQTLSCELYSNLVTRPTGAAVRTQIEALLADSRERSLTVIDFSHVGMIDFSCADEVVAKLLLRYVAAEREDREASNRRCFRVQMLLSKQETYQGDGHIGRVRF